ncbi:MAG TPA: AMP-binding protein [Bryobacteraceae bacterium]|jgi:acyl-CoA synthetase (AMP-forming)/AMP-acid ligase II/thioesterase domain-containing protein|nr:AMP-binding protein [Bryobacteraceae bacterium]
MNLQTGSELSPFQHIRRRAVDAPQATAILAPERERLTYAQLWRQIENIAETFRHMSGRVVAVALPDGPDLTLAILGTSLRCVCAPINPRMPIPEFQAHLTALAPEALIVEAANIPAIHCAEALGIQVWEAQLAPQAIAGVFELSLGNPGSPQGQGSLVDPGLLLSTSATTGRSKLVPLKDANLQAQCLQTARALELSNVDRLLSLMPLFHLQGILTFLAQLYSGGCVICAPGFDAVQFLSWLEEFGPTWYTASPTMHRAILTLLDGRDFPAPCRLRFVRSIGAPLPPTLIASLESALNAPVIEGYGLTEVGAVTSNPLPPGRRKPGSVGVVTGAEVAIFDKSGQPVLPGSEGEIRIRGAAVTAGYWNDPDANRDSFSNGWLRTGDLGRFDEDSYLYITGRVKEVVNRGGEKIMPQEIDVALAAHPAVMEAAGFGIPHPTLGEDIVAAVVLRGGAPVTEHELREFVAGRVAAFKVPRRIVFVDRIPKGATGKTRRIALRDEWAGIVQRATISGASPLELKLVEIWNRILQNEVGPDDDFFAAGGDSLAAIVMLAEARSALAVDPSLLDRIDFFEKPTIRSLARIVSDCGNTSEKPESALLALQPNGSGRPLFLMPDATSEPYYFRGLAKHLGKSQPLLALRYPTGRPLGSHTVEGVAASCRAVICSVQSRGPYRISGHCFGGIVAFETARQLVAAGEEVDLLALLDTTTPGYPKLQPHWRRYAQALRAGLTRRAGHQVTVRDVAAHIGYLAARTRFSASARWRFRLAASPLASVFPQSGGAEIANETAGRNYAPQPTAVRAVQFLAAAQPVGTRLLDDPRMEWRRFALLGFESHQTPGDHLSMLAEPNVQNLAAQLQQVLSRSSAPCAVRIAAAAG